MINLSLGAKIRVPHAQNMAVLCKTAYTSCMNPSPLLSDQYWAGAI